MEGKEYNIIRELGSGANGQVNLVEDKVTKIQYALKTIKKFDKNGGEKQSIYNELVLKKLDHPNIAKIESYEELKDSFIIFYKYIPNSEDMLSIIKNKNKYKYDDVIYANKYSISVKLIRAIKYLKDNNIIHGDIKPQNILINVNTFAPYLIDFDISCEFYDIDNKQNKNKNCNTTYISGTPSYMSPYVLKKNQFCNSIDIYSLGYTLLCFYLNLTTPPWNERTVNGLYKKKKEGVLLLKDDGVYYKTKETETKVLNKVEICRFDDLRKKYEGEERDVHKLIELRNEFVSYFKKIDYRAISVLNDMMNTVTEECISYESLIERLFYIHRDIKIIYKLLNEQL